MLQGKISQHSQSDVLRARMEKAGLTHGEEVRANLLGVRLEEKENNEGVVYFCNMQDIEVVEVLQNGDGGVLPRKAEVEGLRFPRRGTHDLLDVVLYSNGSLQVRADERSKIVRHQWIPLRRWYRKLESIF